MRIRAAMATALASAGILLAGWQSGAHIADTGTATTTSLGSSASSAGGTTTGTSGSSSATSSGTKTTTTAATYDGTAVQTRFGTVQVRVTIQGGKITEVTALQLTDAERKSAQISSRAAPVLRSEVLQAQSADVQTVGGATVTSDAYLTSLQAALDAAHF
ncbi:FMN-binding protein [Paenarthrobacter sp. Y-19]|uniref:FMN-binding protein n=1 Tax=Paenarthrobacter sp. Y-19 TaxID=3031125 RepID=UPI0023DCD948|nr:FMN-binding protein [Paenarthrobacter sp. Y-19]